MMRYRVLPYRQGSKSARELAAALGGKVLKLVGSTFIPTTGDVVVNWGCADADRTAPYAVAAELWEEKILINHADLVRKASNKLLFFQGMKEINLDNLLPPFWTSALEIPSDAYPVVCRTVLAGHSGEGIVIADNPAGIAPASLYVKYIKKQEEYRVHVVKKDGICGSIAVQRKAKRLGVDNADVNWQVRSHANGFVYVREGVSPHPSVVSHAVDALGASGLDFGAVDVIWNASKHQAYVLEINTAPGLEGQTVIDYATAIKEIV